VRVKPDGRTGWKRHDRAAWVEQQPGRPGVEAFNNIYTERFYELGQPPGSLGRIALPVADDDAAKAIVLRLIDKLGFDGVDAGANESLFPLVLRLSQSAALATDKFYAIAYRSVLTPKRDRASTLTWHHKIPHTRISLGGIIIDT
jgi:hypothetical protein